MPENNRQYVLRYRAVMASLRGAGIDYKDEAASVQWLSTTVQAKKNIEIYRMFVIQNRRPA